MLTQDRLKELFTYNENTGDLTRKVTAGGRKAGQVIDSKNQKGYLRVKVDRVEYKVHRVIWLYVYGIHPKDQIDHINQIKDDNRISNLREVDNKTNCMNKPLQKNNTTGVAGVTWRERDKCYYVVINSKYYGVSKSLEQATLLASKMYKKLGYHENHGR